MSDRTNSNAEAANPGEATNQSDQHKHSPAKGAAPALAAVPLVHVFARYHYAWPLTTNGHLKLGVSRDTNPEAQLGVLKQVQPDAQRMPWIAALTRRFDFDAHFAGYEVPGLDLKLSTGAASLCEGHVRMRLAIFDVDGPDHKASPEWRASEAAKIVRVLNAHPGGAFWPTTNGYRLVWQLPGHGIPADGSWSERYAAWSAYLQQRFGLDSDKACSDWTRTFRLPLVRRGGVPTIARGVLPIVHPDDALPGFWDPPIPRIEPKPPKPYAPPSEADGDVLEVLQGTRLGRCYRRAFELDTPGLEVYGTGALPDGTPCVYVRSPFADAYTTPEGENHYAIIGSSDGTGGFSSFHGTDKKKLVSEHFAKLEEMCPRLVTEPWNSWTNAWEPLPPKHVTQAMAAPSSGIIQPPAASVALAQAAGWEPLTGSLVGAPDRVERALAKWRAAHTHRAPGTDPPLQHSAAVLKWLVEGKQLTAHAIAEHFGVEAGQYAATLIAEAQRPEVQNVGRLTRINQLLSKRELRWNEMALTVEIDGERWTDNHTAQARLACEHQNISDPEKPIPNGDIEQRAAAIAHEHSYHPVAEYLAALPPWDGKPRVDSLWSHYFGASERDLYRKLSACFMLAAVRRVLEPGCKVDMLMILHGDQGVYKSSGLKALAGGEPEFTDAAPNFNHRAENAMTLAGCWIWEFAELEKWDKASQNDIKAFVTRTQDNVLLPFERAKGLLKRRSVMIATTNDEKCLKDPTGSRRHPVISVGWVELDAIKRDRDQLWAESLHRVQAGEPHWLSKADEAAAAESNRDHEQADEALEETIVEWMSKPAAKRAWTLNGSLLADGAPPLDPRTVSVRDVLYHALHVVPSRQERAAQTRVGIALKRLGIEQVPNPGKRGSTRYRFRGTVDSTLHDLAAPAVDEHW